MCTILIYVHTYRYKLLVILKGKSSIVCITLPVEYINIQVHSPCVRRCIGILDGIVVAFFFQETIPTLATVHSLTRLAQFTLLL